MVELKIYGSGCANCERLTENAKSAAEALGLDYEIVKETSSDAIIDAGITRTPALAINDQVRLMGKVATPDEIKELLK